MAQTLLLGLGGTGSRVVNKVASELKARKRKINDGEICCAVLDTNENDRKKIKMTKVGVPVIGTSKKRIIDDYFKMYAYDGINDWMPDSPELRQQSMEDGASQMRPKSRLALMDTIADNTIHKLEKEIDKLFGQSDDSKIRVMLVSSLAGGTGSGMFIQTALWLRQYFGSKKCSVTIRGIFLLPDIFVDTLGDMSDDKPEQQSLYANAYGAIRELNAITKIKAKGMVPSLPIRIDGLFDSDKDCGVGQPVFDYAFFIDNVAEGGTTLPTLKDYEQVVARMVYMQLYAPMKHDLYSEEDNLFKRFHDLNEPVFGSCGTAKALYPAEDVINYCALRATRDSLTKGWRLIDEEIKAKQKKEEEKENRGSVVLYRLNPRNEYIRLFDAKTAKTGNNVGKNKLFFMIANDVKNEKRTDSKDGTMVGETTDKVEEFIDRIEELVEDKVNDKDPGQLRSVKLKEDWVEFNPDNLIADMIETVESKDRAVKRFIAGLEKTMEPLAEELVDTICPVDVGDININNKDSIHGLFTKKDNKNRIRFAHPIAIRYMLYKLEARLQDLKDSIGDLENAKNSAVKGSGNGNKKVNFDNPWTRKVTETDPISYLKSKTGMQRASKFIAKFQKLYFSHNKGQYELCKDYAIAAIKSHFIDLFSGRIATLIDVVEDFFAKLNQVSNTVDDDISANLDKNKETSEKIVYVCASPEDKESIYKSLNFDTNNSNTDINEMVVNALYNKFCAFENPTSENNAPYVDKRVENSFYADAVSAYTKMIKSSKKAETDMDIYSAVCKESDLKYERELLELEDEFYNDDDRLDIDPETDDGSDTDSRKTRHTEAMGDLVDRLKRLGAPFLITDTVQLEDKDEHLVDSGKDSTGSLVDDTPDHLPIKKRKTFWGFSPILVNKCPDLAQYLGVNVEQQQNAAYQKYELDCYRAVYGIMAGNVEKFNELNNGDYYTSYNSVVHKMIRGVSRGDTKVLVNTPHLDKTWHLFLPYITPKMQKTENEKFYRLFWLALAYDMISVTKAGKFQIKRVKRNDYGKEYEEEELVIYKGNPVSKADVVGLLTALRLDGTFMLDAARLENKFADECENIVDYEGTEFLRGRAKTALNSKGEVVKTKTVVGGLGSERDHNAMTIIVRYNNCPDKNNDITNILVNSLESLCKELVANKYEANENTKIENKAYELCRRIYVASTMRDKDIRLISHWMKA